MGLFRCRGLSIWCLREEGPGCHAGGGGNLVGPEEGGAAVLGELDTQVLGVSGGEGFGVAGAKRRKMPPMPVTRAMGDSFWLEGYQRWLR